MATHFGDLNLRPLLEKVVLRRQVAPFAEIMLKFVVAVGWP